MRNASYIFLALLLLGAPARAADSSEAPRREASAHFQRGVELHNDGDFRGALVEFKKAYAIWPRANVLYDVGQTEFQLLDYAAALKTMERYLAETGPSAAHRSEVESTVETLRGRVGRIAVTTGSAECEITVDEQPAGTTPLAAPILVSVGARRVAVLCPGGSVTSRQVEVAAGETERVDVKVKAQPASALALRAPLSPVAAEPQHRSAKSSMTVGWVVTGVLAAAAGGLGIATLVEQSQLQTMKQTFPVTSGQLDRQGSMTLGLAIATDALAVAALVGVGVSTYLTVKYHKERKLKLGLAGAGMYVATTF